MIINDLFNNKKTAVAESQLDAGEDPYYFRVRHQTKRDIELEITMPKAWDAVGPAYATYEEAQAALKALQAKYPNERFTYTQHPRISTMGGTPHRAFPPGVAEGQLELNTPDPVVVVQDQQGKILDKINLSVAAQKYKLGQPENIKKQLAHQNYTKIGNYTIVSPMTGQPQDATTQGVAEGIADDMAAMAQKKFPNAYISKNGQEVQKPENWDKKYTPPAAPPADLEKQQRDLTARYPNIDELVRRAELNRDPDYEMADGEAYYAARDAEQNYQKLRQIQRVIQGLNESLNRSHLP